jgi:hypothetical protein
MNSFLRIGTDAEYFVSNADGVGSAIGLIGGSKISPKIVPYGNFQEDNVLAEFAIDPVSSKEEWMSHIRIVSGHLRGLMTKQHHTLVCKSSHVYDKAQLKSFDPLAMEMGCEADFNVYENKANPKPNARTTLRTAAAHVHFSYVLPTKQKTDSIIKCLDYMLGVWSVIEDTDTLRRELYGKAGACRYKEYGGEYRTLGNFWLTTDAKKEYVYDVTRNCVQYANTLLPRLHGVLNEKDLQGIINGYRKDKAKLLYPLLATIYQEVCYGS